MAKLKTPPREGDYYIDGPIFYFFNGLEWEKYFHWEGKPYSMSQVEIMINQLEAYLETT